MGVSLPYEITLLSNLTDVERTYIFVSLPYEITLLSNTYQDNRSACFVSLPYEITLLSNLKPQNKNCRASRKCHYNIVTSYYLISLHIQMNFARVFINNYSFRILFYHIRLTILHQKYANLLIMHIFIKFFNLILCQIRK